MAQKILVMGESGTGKSTSMRNFKPNELVVINPVNKPLPFKGKFEMLNAVTDSSDIVKFMKDAVKAGKKVIVVDDFQYILSIPYMNRIKEAGWDKWNDFGANYFEIIDVCAELPEDVTVYYLTHTETLENGVTTIKLIGKLLREKITIEGLFTIVLRTQVIDGKYYFLTQNSGKDTVKSPMGMFPAYAIDNDLKYVDEKIRSYYEIGSFKTDAEMQEADEAVSSDIAKPDANGRRARGARTEAPKERKTRTRDEVIADNKQKTEDYMDATNEALNNAFPDQDEVPFDEATKVIDTVPVPELETPPRRTRGERKAAEEAMNPPVVGKEVAFYHTESDDNYIKLHEGDVIPADAFEITEDEFKEGLKKIATSSEPKTRTRKSREITPTSSGDDVDEAPVTVDKNTGEASEPVSTGRRRRTRS